MSIRKQNHSSVSEFFLMGLPIRSEQQGVFFALFLGMYLTTVLGNLLIILLIRLDPHLHTPMYFFLSHLALTDISFSSVTIPKMLMNMQTQDQSITYAECVMQMYFFIFFTNLDNFLLTSMAYDRYVAICHPLHYTTIMREGLCTLLVSVSWILSCANALCHSLLLTQLSFCADNMIPHFFCDLGALLKLSCSDTSLNELVIFIAIVAIIILPLISILVSYGRIGATILEVLSTKGICKALSTCGSHLSVVSLYYGAIVGLYLVPSSSTSSTKGIFASVMYTVVTPMLNPFIYSLRNRDMKGALEKLFHKPLHYNTAMSPQACALMLGTCWVLTNCPALVHTLLLTRVMFCAHKAIAHFYCDPSALLKLACSETHINELMIITLSVLFLTAPLMLIVLSYVRISWAVFGILSPGGRWKAFSTCGSHLTVVLLFYGSLMGVYLLPPSAHSAERESRAAILYMVIIPMLNPFIYSLRNKDMKEALGKLFGSGKAFFLQ
uniref:G-protein coupled receptors family 1 profile domain-containing protein n=1 Tax=Catagonus wagneri TaxID=51154 RepID=A0A8C3X343_9CETA